MPKNKGGRPKISKERVSKLEEGFRRAFNVSEACLYAGISRETYYDYMKKDKKFSDKMNFARRFVYMEAKQNIVSKLVNEDDVSLSQWWLEKKDKEFKSNGINIKNEQVVNQIDEHQLNKIVKAINQSKDEEIGYLKKRLNDGKN